MKKQQIKAGVASIILGAMAPMALLVPSVSAATATWAGHHPVEDYDGMWATASNWESLTKPGAGDTAAFTVDGIVQDIENDETALSLASLVFSGENTFTSSKSYTITGNGLTLTSGIAAIMTGSGGDHKVGIDITLGADATFATTGSNSLQVGEDDTTLDLGSNDLTLNADGGTITLAGEIDGSGKIVIDGGGKVSMLAAPATGFTGATEVTQGSFVVTPTTEGNIVINGGTLKGSSDLLGTVSMSSGSIAPGNSPGCLGTSDLTLTGGSYDVELAGKDACTGYDQMAVVGTVALGSNTTLNVTALTGYTPAVNSSYGIILNDGTDAVTGTFKDLANGAKFTVAGFTYQINYDAGDGNDVLLLVTGTPTVPDTGLGSILTNPMITLSAVFAAVAVIGGLKFAEQRRK